MHYLTILLTLILCALPAHADQKLILGGAEHEVTRTSLAVLKKAYSRIGLDVTIRLYPSSKRSLVESNAGHVDGEVNRIKNIQMTYPDLIPVPVSINSIDSMAFSCGKILKIDGWGSISSLRIGIMRGIRYAEDATRHMPHVTIKDNYDQLFELMMLGRLDVIIASRPTGYWLSQKNGGKCIRSNEPPLTSLPLYHYLNKDHADLVPRLTKVLQAMRDSGEMAAIRDKATQQYRLQGQPQ